MTTEQFFAVLGTIYLAPHTPPIFSQMMGFGLFFAVACKNLGWL